VILRSQSNSQASSTRPTGIDHGGSFAVKDVQSWPVMSGNPITYYGMGSNKRKWTKAGVNARIHDLRHTTGMRTLRRTGNLKVVQTLLGHSDIKTTAIFYTDAMVEDLRAAMEATAPREINPPKRIEKKEQGE